MNGSYVLRFGEWKKFIIHKVLSLKSLIYNILANGG